MIGVVYDTAVRRGCMRVRGIYVVCMCEYMCARIGLYLRASHPVRPSVDRLVSSPCVYKKEKEDVRANLGFVRYQIPR